MSTTIEVKNAQSQTLFNLNTGIIEPMFKRQLELVGIVSKQIFSDYNADHVMNVNEVLQKNGCFQRDFDLYKNGGTSEFKITVKQAKVFLDHDYSHRSEVMPTQKSIPHAVFPCGVEPTMHKRFNSLKESMDKGYQYQNIHFIMKDSAAKAEVSAMVDKEYKELLKNVSVNFVVADTDLNIFEEGLATLDDQLKAGYAIISDASFASKVGTIATRVLPGVPFHGIASSPIKDWTREMNLFGYNKALGSPEKAAVAWAQSAWNFKARQVHSEMRAWQAKQLP